jgi:predicted enzyme related to lactoylglutathione lyase
MAMLALVKGAKPAQELPSPSQIGNVGWHELFAADPKKAFAFYSEIFGWQKAEGGAGARPNYQPFSAGGEIIGGLLNKVESLPISCWLYYFNVRDIDAAIKIVQARGGEAFYGPVALEGGGRIAHCQDPQGAFFALLDRRRAVGFSTIAPL